MNLYAIREVVSTDITKIVEIYNSNINFLVNHLGLDQVDEAFITSEILIMKKSNFLSCVIIDLETHEIVGVLDYKPDINVYLSLIMIHAKFHGQQIGSRVYTLFEKMMLASKKASIRIDVVYDYEHHILGFWEKKNFIAQKETELQWGTKNSKALIMTKVLI